MELNKEIELNLKLKIISVFDPAERLDELKEIPELPTGQIDYWQASKLLCEKDGGRMPTVEELQLISAADRAGLIDTGLEYRDDWFWSSKKDSLCTAWNVSYSNGIEDADSKGFSDCKVLCIRKD